MLTRLHAADPDIVKAAAELLANAKRLIVAGQFANARRILELLMAPGPWKIKRGGRLAQELARLLPRVCVLCGTDSPKIGQLPAMSREEAAAWAQEEARQYLGLLAMPIRSQLRPAGENWSEAYLARLPGSADKTAYNDFCIDAEFVLKDRLAAARRSERPKLGIGDLVRFVMGKGEAPNFEDFDITNILSAAVAIEVAKPARSIATASIGSATIACLQQSGQPPTYMESFILQGVIVLSLQDGLSQSAADAAIFLAESSAGTEGLDVLTQMAVLKPVAQFFASGVCAEPLGIDAAALAGYLRTLESRPAAQDLIITRKQPYIADTKQSFAKILSGTLLEGRELIELPILDTGEKAYAMPVGQDETEKLWAAARGLVERSGRWPLCTTVSSVLPLREALVDADLFSRFYFEEAPDVDDVSPRALLAAADAVDVEAFLRRVAEAYEEEETDADDDGSGEPARGRQDWYWPAPLVLLFLPTPNSWDALAYLHWYGASTYGSEHYIALGHRWQKQFGAELFAHFGTILQCFVSRPPTTHDAALALAREHDLAAPYTLASSGESLQDHAAGLMNYDRWFLHERP